MGEMLDQTERAKGTRTVGGDKRSGGTVVVPPETSPTLASLGISKNESARAQELAQIPREEFEEIRNGLEAGV